MGILTRIDGCYRNGTRCSLLRCLRILRVAPHDNYIYEAVLEDRFYHVGVIDEVFKLILVSYTLFLSLACESQEGLFRLGRGGINPGATLPIGVLTKDVF